MASPMSFGKTLISIRSMYSCLFLQYAAAGALWAVSPHPLNREQLVHDSRLLATLVRFLPKAPPPLDEPPPPETVTSPAIPGPPSTHWRPLPTNRAVLQHPEEDAVAGGSSSGQADASGGGVENVDTSEDVSRSDPEPTPRTETGAEDLQTGARHDMAHSSESLDSIELVGPSVDSIERSRLAESLTPSGEGSHERDTLAEASTQTPSFSEEGRSQSQGETVDGGSTEGRHETAYRDIRESWLEATERLSENLQRQTDFLGRRTRRLRGLSGTAPSVSEAAAAASGGTLPSDGEAAEMEPESSDSGRGDALNSTLPRGVLGSRSRVPGTTETEMVLAETMETVTDLDALETSVASGLGSESAGVWAAPSERDPPADTNRLQSSAAMDELRSLVRTERARAESFVARARALVAEERAIRGNIGALEHELAIAVRERDDAVRERDRTSAVLGRALAALSSARDQLAALGGTLRAANSAAPPRVPSAIPAGTLMGSAGTAPGAEPEEYELLEMLETPPGVPSPDPQQARKACLMACLLLGNLSLNRGVSGTMFEGERWPEAMAGVLRFVTGLGGLDAFWATMLWTTVQPLVDLLQSKEEAVQVAD